MKAVDMQQWSNSNKLVNKWGISMFSSKTPSTSCPTFWWISGISLVLPYYKTYILYNKLYILMKNVTIVYIIPSLLKLLQLLLLIEVTGGVLVWKAKIYFSGAHKNNSIFKFTALSKLFCYLAVYNLTSLVTAIIG